MSGPEHRLEVLLTQLAPALDPTPYAFVTLPEGTPLPDDVAPLASFREDEGPSLIVTTAEAARQGWSNHFPSRRITLQVHSALAAVGMIAAVAAWLAEAGIPANVVSAVHHDHLFVPVDRATDAMTVIQQGIHRCRQEA